MARLGLKIWSTNRGYRASARALRAAGVFDFVEMTFPAESGLDDVAFWRNEPYPFVLHGPHSLCGLNLAVPGLEGENRAQLQRLDQARLILQPERVVLHPGVDGTVEETIRQMVALRATLPDLFARALVENKPQVGLRGERCVGASPEEVRAIRSATGLGFCFDIGHAICYANAAARPWPPVIEEFLAMAPALYHLSDGDAAALTDAHEHLGAGTFDLPRIIRRIPPDAAVCLETRKDSATDLDDFARDVAYFRECAA